MSGIAGLLISLGHRVSGSDKVENLEVRRLIELGLRFRRPADGSGVEDAEVVIYSSAIRDSHPDVLVAKARGIPMYRRAEALAALIGARKGLVVSGMHGKTTTSSLLSHVLRHAGVRPSHYVGAEIPILGTNSHWDEEGEYFVAEGDESDGTLALYSPEHAIVLNIEEEHLDYYANLSEIEAVYGKLVAQTRGNVIYCGDDENATRVCKSHRGAISYGENEGAVYRFDALHLKDFQSHFRVLKSGEPMGAAVLNIPGRHNVLNALAVIAVTDVIGVPFERIASALETFRGARRRFEIRHRSERVMVVDDYGHHPTEIRATLTAAANAGRSRVLALFQPHRFTRTAALAEEFGEAFFSAEKVWVSEIYAASEIPMDGISGGVIAEAAERVGHEGVRYVENRWEAMRELGREIRSGDCVVVMGAGNISEQATALARDIAMLERLQIAMGGGVARVYEPMSKHTTLRVGGPAQWWIEPETEEGFAEVVKLCKSEGLGITVVGRGSNLLIQDGGIRGVVVSLTRGEFRKVEVGGGFLVAGAGVKQTELAHAARDAGIGGFEWFEGIPGNVGGAVRMNAGAMGGETFRQVVSVRYVDGSGEFHTVTPEQIDVGYRSVPFFRDRYVVSVTFAAALGNRDEIVRRLEDSVSKRRSTQPRESSAGCFFKNPVSIPAGRLIDELGLKGLAVGDARVSEVHGNFLVNAGQAKATDFLTLIGRIREVALRERGVNLETEVQILGEPLSGTE
jgi:UDP-N-acetylmuramate--L-alanine ligase/UDP-N-acetylenolpyruvoylglucosamine reductase